MRFPLSPGRRSWGTGKHRRKKTGPQAGFLNQETLITSKQPERQQQPKRLPKQPKQQPKRQQQRPKQPKQQRQPEQQPEQQPVPTQPPVPEQRPELLLSSSKQPGQQPSGRRSAGIFSWVFLN
jgi:hypothetical protein